MRTAYASDCRAYAARRQGGVVAEDEQPAQVPERVALLWGLRPTTRRGRRPSLTLGDITRAAVRIADAEGLAAVSMSRVAAELGSSTMALYRYVSDKNELLTLMVDNAWGGPPRPSDAATSCGT